MKNDNQKEISIFKRWYGAVCPILSRFSLRKYRLSFEKHTLPQGPNLILANHVTKDDQFFIASFFKKQLILFVAGENAFRNKFLRKLAEKKGGIIIHMRGVSSFDTIRQMTKRLRQGCNVCIFPEGATTFDGRTQKIDDSLSKMAKMCGANLVLCRIEGGYFSRPRWGDSVRHGRISVAPKVILHDELSGMSVQEITGLINSSLYTDAYKEQANNLIKYVGKNPCKGLESCIYECPVCRKINTLKTSSTSIFCECGFSAEYDEYGRLTDNEGKEYQISDLCDAQKNDLKDRVLKAESIDFDDPSGLFLFEDIFDCKQIDFDGKPTRIGEVKVRAFADRIEYTLLEKENKTEKEISYTQIQSVFIFLRNTMNCRIEGEKCCYELKGDFSSNALKYRDLFEILKEK